MYAPKEYYSKWNKPGSERQTPHDLTYMWNLTNKIETEAQLQGTDWQLPEGRGQGTGWKKVKELAKEHICITHEHGQWWGDWWGDCVWEGRGDRCKWAKGEKVGTALVV